MWGRFTERAKQVVMVAREEAARLGSHIVETQHLLLGICRAPDGVAARALENLGVSIEGLIGQIEQGAQGGPPVVLNNNPVFSPGVMHALALAVEEARGFNHGYIGTEHILLGLYREGKGRAAQALQATQADAAGIRAELVRLSGGGSSSVWDKFTARAKQAVSIAREETGRLGSEMVRTEHLLLGLCQAPACVAAVALENLGAGIKGLVAEIERRTQTGPAFVPGNDLLFSPGAKEALGLAAEEARGLGHGHIGTEHLLLGLVKGGKDGAAQVLRDFQIDTDRIRAEVLRLMENRG